MISFEERRVQFRSLHDNGTFIIPNPWDIGSARLLEAMGFKALATTSAGFAASLGRLDMNMTLDLLLSHVEEIAPATELPLNVDAERCFAENAEGVAHTVHLLCGAGASGVSIEDWNPSTNSIDPIDVATERVAAAVTAAEKHNVTVTARCENHLHGVSDLHDTITRLCAYRDAGAPVVYAPGLIDPEIITSVGEAVGVPMNVLIMPGGPTVSQLRTLGVRRLSTGSALARAAMGAMVQAAQSLLDGESYSTTSAFVHPSLVSRAFV